jgi:tRNA dimethylallyltransferase
MQLYSDLKILTNFPSDEQLRRIPHNLFGILASFDSCNAALWADMAANELDRIHAEGKIAILCGGTGFYLKALLDGLSPIPKIPVEIRRRTREKFDEIGRDKFFLELKKKDPDYVDETNVQRMLRAYEVVSFTRKSLKYWWNRGARDAHSHDCRSYLSVILDPEREQLSDVCRQRIYSTINNGAIDEVRAFNAKYISYHGPLIHALGYREISSFLKLEISLEDCLEKIHQRTRQYAKRQRTWFRNQMKAGNFFHGFGHHFDVDRLINNIN